MSQRNDMHMQYEEKKLNGSVGYRNKYFRSFVDIRSLFYTLSSGLSIIDVKISIKKTLNNEG